MLSSRHLVTDVHDIPQTWVFEHYGRLGEQLDGGEVNIKSLFNELDKTPSMYIFYSKKYKKYWFHDFSTGKSGDGIRLVQELHSCSFARACEIIRIDYSRYQQHNTYEPARTQPAGKYHVTDWEARQWNRGDASYWTAFNIGSELLRRYHVKPLSGYTMANESDPADHFRISGENIYGYFTPAGDLYKIYRPRRQRNKFIKVAAYVQGIDQLRDRRCLLIVASLKDGLSLESLGLEVDFIAPESENTLLDESLIAGMLERYHGKVFTLLDNDEAGIKAMARYRKQFGLEPLLLTLSKDISDSIRDFYPLYVRDRIVPMIDRKLSMVVAA